MTQTFHFPDDMPPDQCRRIVAATLKEQRDREEKERWFQSEVRRRGLDGPGLIASLLGFG